MAGAIEIVLFDLGKVVVDFDTSRIVTALRRFSAASPEEITRLLSVSPLYHDFERGAITPAALHAELQRTLSFTLPYEAFVPLWNDIFTRKPEMEAVVRAAKGKCRIGALSNTNELHWEFLRSNFDIMNEFDEYFLSHQLHCRKPEEAIYRKVLERTGVPGERIMYIDDIPAFIAAACRAGIRGVVFESPRQVQELL